MPSKITMQIVCDRCGIESSNVRYPDYDLNNWFNIVQAHLQYSGTVNLEFLLSRGLQKGWFCKNCYEEWREQPKKSSESQMKIRNLNNLIKKVRTELKDYKVTHKFSNEELIVKKK